MSGALPLPTELRALVVKYEELQRDIVNHEDLSARLEQLVKAREQGNERMNLPVDLGLGYSIEGVV